MKVSRVLFGLSLLGLIGICGGIEHGGDLINAVWAIPLLAIMGGCTLFNAKGENEDA